MYAEIDTNVLNKIFCLSDRALLRMVNHLFQTEYADDECIWKEWTEPGEGSVSLLIGGTRRYGFRIRYLDGCVRLMAEDQGFGYCRPGRTEPQVREPGSICFGENVQEKYTVIRESSGGESVRLLTRNITFSDRSAEKLEERGLIIFLPFLIHLFCSQEECEEERRETLKYFMIHDIVGTLYMSMRRGNLNVYDVQKLKQLCRQMMWSLLPGEPWMQEPGFQKLVLDALETDLELVEKLHRLELQQLWNKWMEN